MLTYCPYTDRDLQIEETSSEHIIPLALGGANGLELRVDEQINAKLGSELDGRLANEFLMAMLRTKYGARGHSGKEPWANIKHASYGDDARPAQVQFHRKHGFRLWDARDRKEQKDVGSFQIYAMQNIDLPVRFVAKVGLAAGYFAYGDLFRNHVDHHHLRQVMLIDPAELDNPEGSSQIELNQAIARVDSYLYDPPSESEWELLVIRKFCSGVNGSVVVLIPGPNCFQVSVGILGQFLATINVPANTISFPNEGDFHWGHVLSVVRNEIQRESWFNCMQKWVSDMA